MRYLSEITLAIRTASVKPLLRIRERPKYMNQVIRDIQQNSYDPIHIQSKLELLLTHTQRQVRVKKDYQKEYKQLLKRFQVLIKIESQLEKIKKENRMLKKILVKHDPSWLKDQIAVDYYLDR